MSARTYKKVHKTAVAETACACGARYKKKCWYGSAGPMGQPSHTNRMKKREEVGGKASRQQRYEQTGRLLEKSRMVTT